MSIASELQDKIDAKAAIKASIEAKGVTVGDVKLNQYASKVDAIAQDPSIPVGVGQHLVTFYDFDGKVLKRQRVNTGKNATAPAIPTHQYLTFAEWNNPFTNVQSDIDTGAIHNTTDGKTYLFITLTAVTGLAPTLYFSKSSTSLMTIDWGDGTTSTSTTSGNQSINHVYATAGNYIITVDNSAGGTWTMGHGSAATRVFFGYEGVLRAVFIGLNTLLNAYTFDLSYNLESISISQTITDINKAILFRDCRKLKVFVSNNNLTLFGGGLFQNNYSLVKFISKLHVKFTGGATFQNCYGLNKIIFSNEKTTIENLEYTLCLNILQYIFLSTTPPTLANVSAFSGINPICKIYVPDASVEAYKAATNWSLYADYIYPLSQKQQSDE